MTTVGDALVLGIAQVCHEANRAWCRTLGDESQPSWGEAPAWQVRSCLEGVSHILRGRVGSPEASHSAWLEHKTAEGWVWGPVKDEAAKTHPSIVTFEELAPAVQAKDRLFFAIVQALAPR